MKGISAPRQARPAALPDWSIPLGAVYWVTPPEGPLPKRVEVLRGYLIDWPRKIMACRIRSSDESLENVTAVSSPILPVLRYPAVPYSNEFNRAIDSAILRCSSAKPASRKAIAAESSDCTLENFARSALCSRSQAATLPCVKPTNRSHSSLEIGRAHV